MKGKRRKVPLRRRTEERTKSEDRKRKRRPKANEWKFQKMNSKVVVAGGPPSEERKGPARRLVGKNPLCALRKPSPFSFTAGTRPEEKKKPGIIRIYMGESPGRTSLTESLPMRHAPRKRARRPEDAQSRREKKWMRPTYKLAKLGLTSWPGVGNKSTSWF